MRNRHKAGVWSALILCLSFSFGIERAFAVSSIQPDSVTSDQRQKSRNFTYYTVRRDFRKCIYPLCGGYFVKAVNRRSTRCADKTSQSECYVTDINWKKSGLSPKQIAEIDKQQGVMLRGRLRQVEFEGFGPLGEFVATEAWVAATDKVAKGRFVRLSNSGIVCVTTPCPSIRQDLLNRKRSRNIHEVNLSGVGATAEQIEQAMKAIQSSDDGILSAGRNRYSHREYNKGITFLASQFYLREKPDPTVDRPNLVGVVTLSPTCGGAITPGQVCHQPYVGAWVQVLNTSNDVHASAITDSNGMFSVDVAPGDYVVRVRNGYVAPPPVPVPGPIAVEPKNNIEDPMLLDRAPDATQVDTTVYPYPIYPFCPDTGVTVPEQGGVKVSINCDTGIR